MILYESLLCPFLHPFHLVSSFFFFSVSFRVKVRFGEPLNGGGRRCPFKTSYLIRTQTGSRCGQSVTDSRQSFWYLKVHNCWNTQTRLPEITDPRQKGSSVPVRLPSFSWGFHFRCQNHFSSVLTQTRTVCHPRPKLRRTSGFHVVRKARRSVFSDTLIYMSSDFSKDLITETGFRLTSYGTCLGTSSKDPLLVIKVGVTISPTPILWFHFDCNFITCPSLSPFYLS